MLLARDLFMPVFNCFSYPFIIAVSHMAKKFSLSDSFEHLNNTIYYLIESSLDDTKKKSNRLASKLTSPIMPQNE